MNNVQSNLSLTLPTARVVIKRFVVVYLKCNCGHLTVLFSWSKKLITLSTYNTE